MLRLIERHGRCFGLPIRSGLPALSERVDQFRIASYIPPPKWTIPFVPNVWELRGTILLDVLAPPRVLR